MSLAGCASSNFVTLDAAGKAFPRAEYAVQGKTSYDQLWIDKTIEAEVAGFGFKRPMARPAEFNAKPAQHTVVALPPSKPLILTPTQPEVITIQPKKHWYQKRLLIKR